MKAESGELHKKAKAEAGGEKKKTASKVKKVAFLSTQMAFEGRES